MISKAFSGRKDRQYCLYVDQIENYDKAINSDEMYICHHKLEAFFTVKELKAMGKYYNRPARELIFLTYKEHRNWPHKGFKASDNTLKSLTNEQKKCFTPDAIEKRASKKRKVLIRCIETGEIHYECWYRKNGFGNARFVADGTRKSCKGLHFEFIK